MLCVAKRYTEQEEQEGQRSERARVRKEEADVLLFLNYFFLGC